MQSKPIIYSVAAFAAMTMAQSSLAGADVNFWNATVGTVETRSDAWGSWLLLTLNDSSGNKITNLCSAADDRAAISLPLSDSAAKPVLGIALTAKALGKTVTGWGVDPPQGKGWCRIGNFAIFP